MAIFRQGKRIGPFDIRLGLPRGREYDNIPGDPRLKSRANPETTINRFRAAISNGKCLNSILASPVSRYSCLSSG